MVYPLRLLPSGHIFISSIDNCDGIVDSMLEIEYNEDFCLALEFTDEFTSRLMEAGFLVMSANLHGIETGGKKEDEEPFFVSLPKLHTSRSILFFPELHIRKSVRPVLDCYELRVNQDFDLILSKCLEIHGEDWLTPPLVDALKCLRKRSDLPAWPVSFALYRDGVLKAGEFGVVVGRVYTSYSGYYEEDNAGTVQMILMAKWLEKTGFAFLDFGMPLDYKTALGARDLTPQQFVEVFRVGRLF